MASELVYNVYSPANEHVAACKYLEDAAGVVAQYGDHSKIRFAYWCLWHEGEEDLPAAESFDNVREVCTERLLIKQRKAYERVHASREAAQLARELQTIPVSK